MLFQFHSWSPGPGTVFHRISLANAQTVVIQTVAAGLSARAES